jgi:hypothetical protein
MPRIPRGETAGGIYHIIMRMQVFDDMEDYEYFLELLKKASKRENVEIHAYCTYAKPLSFTPCTKRAKQPK